MNDDDWIESVRKRAAAGPRDGAEYDKTRTSLVDVYRLLAAMPAGSSGVYRLINEGGLVTAAVEAYRTLDAGDWSSTSNDLPCRKDEQDQISTEPGPSSST